MLQSGQVSSRFGHSRVLVPMHSHGEALLIVGVRGSATIGTEERDFTLPARSLLWLAGHTPHRVQTTADHHSLILSFPPELVARATGWLEASGFVHDLIERVARAPDSERRDHLTAVLVDELAEPIPTNALLSRVSELLERQPKASVAALAQRVGMSERSFRRWFRAETGTTFTRWQQDLTIERAIQRLGRGESVKRVAADLGYTSASAFSAMFKRITNVSPQCYLRSP